MAGHGDLGFRQVGAGLLGRDALDSGVLQTTGQLGDPFAVRYGEQGAQAGTSYQSLSARRAAASPRVSGASISPGMPVLAPDRSEPSAPERRYYWRCKDVSDSPAWVWSSVWWPARPRGLRPRAPSQCHQPARPLPTASTTEEPAGSVSVHILGDEPVLVGAAVNNDWVLPACGRMGRRDLSPVRGRVRPGFRPSITATTPPRRTARPGPWEPRIRSLPWASSWAIPARSRAASSRSPMGRGSCTCGACPAPGARGADLYRATAPEAAGPWTADPAPILRGTAGAWDSQGLDFPSVVHTSTGYLMLYDGQQPQRAERGADRVRHVHGRRDLDQGRRAAHRAGLLR